MKLTAGLFSLSVLAASTLAAQTNPTPVCTVKLSSDSVKVGAKFKAVVTVKFADGFHGYQNPPTDEFQVPVTIIAGDKVFKVSKVTYPKGKPYTMEGDKKANLVYANSTNFTVDCVAPKQAGTYEIKLEVKYQQCTNRDCYPPSSVFVTAKVKVQ